MSILTGNVNSTDILELISTVRAGLNVLPNEINIKLAPAAATLALTYGASTLLAAGESTAEGRTALIIQNLGPSRIRVGQSSANAIYEEGLAVEPGETKVFNFTGNEDDINLYGRAMGYKTKVKVWEV